MMFNELEIISWCYTMYLLMTYEEIKEHLEKEPKPIGEVKYCNRDELVLAAAIFAKVIYINQSLSSPAIMKKNHKPIL